MLPPRFDSKLFDRLTNSQIGTIVASARQRTISANQVLQDEAQPSGYLRLLLTGLAAFYKATPGGNRLFLRWISPGDSFGLATLIIPQQPYLVTVRTLGPTSVLEWERDVANALVSQIARLRHNAYTIANDYMSALADVLVAYATQTAQERLARMLVESAEQVGHASHDGGVEVHLTNEQLAEMVGVSMFTVSRELNEWQRRGVLTKYRGKILLRTPERLVSRHRH